MLRTSYTSSKIILSILAVWLPTGSSGFWFRSRIYLIIWSNCFSWLLWGRQGDRGFLNGYHFFPQRRMKLFWMTTLLLGTGKKKGELVQNFLTQSIFSRYDTFWKKTFFFLVRHICNFYKQNFSRNFWSRQERERSASLFKDDNSGDLSKFACGYANQTSEERTEL